MALPTFTAIRRMSKWAYQAAGFCKYGLWRDDCLYEDEDVLEALKRLPDHIIDERQFRMVRATQYSMMHQILPKEQWTKYEEDKLYLTPIVEIVRQERLEREKWHDEH